MQATLTDSGSLPETTTTAAAPTAATRGIAPPDELTQPPLAPRHEASGTRNPPHTSIESTMAPTSEFVRYLLLALPTRYIGRGIIGIATDNQIGHPNNPNWLNRPFITLRKGVEHVIDRFITNKLESEVNTQLTAHPLGIAPAAGRDNPTKTQTTKALATPSGTELRGKINRTLGRWNASGLTHDTVQWAYNSETAHAPRITSESKNKIRANVKQSLNGMVYGHTLGVGSTLLTASYSKMVYEDIKSIFSEAVAYEIGKDANDVTFKDIRKSDNRIVQGTVSNWYSKTLGRLATDALFFVSAFGKAEKFTDAALGIKGLQALFETWKREPTMFEQITTLIHNKINPKNGLGQTIGVGDVFDLYQHYHLRYSPAKAFTNVVDNDAQESRAWIKGKVIFDRITELLNDTYAYKHATAIDPSTKQPITRANFALPKFIYLLGHDLIDPQKPAQTLLLVEAANSVGMKAVRAIETELKRGTPVAELTQRYLHTTPETLLAETRANTPAATAATSPAEASPAPTAPTNRIEGERTHPGTLLASTQPTHAK